ncbi:MAG: hypothetical protein KAI86_13725 [Desulfobacterales bacterium]|nr:hypothetical protein [Desulfobacterales bacterium]
MKSSTSHGEEFRVVGQDLNIRAGRLQDLVAEVPQQIRYLKAYGEYLVYVGNEIDRGTEHGIDFSSSPALNTAHIEQTLNWEVPSPDQIANTATLASSTSGAVAEMAVEYGKQKPELELFLDPPESFRELKTTGETIQGLNSLNPGIGDRWQAAWDSISVGSVDSVKSAAVNARTVIDEISWKTPYDHLKTLSWCKLDEEDRPTRATRYAWILYGDNLSAQYNNDPSNDLVWKSFHQAYKRLNKYVHISELTKADILSVETQLKIIQIGLEQYLREGFERLNQLK